MPSSDVRRESERDELTRAIPGIPRRVVDRRDLERGQGFARLRGDEQGDLGLRRAARGPLDRQLGPHALRIGIADVERLDLVEDAEGHRGGDGEQNEGDDQDPPGMEVGESSQSPHPKEGAAHPLRAASVCTCGTPATHLGRRCRRVCRMPRKKVSSITSHFLRWYSRQAVPRRIAMDYEQLLYEVSGGVATVTLNRPEQRNALSSQMLEELVDAMARVRDDDDVRAVVLTGAGEKVFCAGADLGGFAADAPLVAKHFSSDLFLEFFRLMPRLGKPSLCAANGHVLAGGMGLALSCDLVIAREGITLRHARDQHRRVPLHDHGDHLPQRPAQEGQRDDAAGRADLGGAGGRATASPTRSSPRTSSTPPSPTGPAKLASKSPVLMRLGHDAMYRQDDMALDDALEFLRSQLSLTFSTEDIQEGVKAFFEKREPEWTGGSMSRFEDP